MRFILTARENGSPIVKYLTAKGNVTSNAERAYVFESKKDVEEHREYFQRGSAWTWTVEQLPARMPVARAVLFARDI